MSNKERIILEEEMMIKNMVWQFEEVVKVKEGQYIVGTNQVSSNSVSAPITKIPENYNAEDLKCAVNNYLQNNDFQAFKEATINSITDPKFKALLTEMFTSKSPELVKLAMERLIQKEPEIGTLLGVFYKAEDSKAFLNVS